MDPVVSAKLERSLLKVSEIANVGVPLILRQACADIALTFLNVMSDNQMYKTLRDNSLKALDKLASLKVRTHI